VKPKPSALTLREKEVLVLVARGLTNQEIADQIRTTAGKIKTLLHQACVKLGAHNRIEAVRLAMSQQVIKVDDIFSLDELAEFLGSLGPDAVETIAQLMRRKFDHRHPDLLTTQIPSRDEKQDDILTQREREVLALVARGLSNQEIAEQLYMSTSSVRTFLYQACVKLEASTRAQAFISAIRRGAVSVDEVFTLDELVELLNSLGPEAMENVAQTLRRKLEQERAPSGAE
jgi:DNA-binding NarL/FixJ family response regulator